MDAIVWQQGTALVLMHDPRVVSCAQVVSCSQQHPFESQQPDGMRYEHRTSVATPCCCCCYLKRGPTWGFGRTAGARHPAHQDASMPHESALCIAYMHAASLCSQTEVNNTFASCACLTLHHCAQRVTTNSPWKQPLPRSCCCRHAGHGCCHMQELASRMRVAALEPSSGPVQCGAKSSVSWAL